MKQRTLLIAAVAMIPFALAAQQSPPTPPSPATPKTPPPSQAAPVTPPVTKIIPLYPDYIDREEIQRISEEARRAGQQAAEEGRRAAEQARIAMEDARWQMKDLNFDFKYSMPDFKVSIPEFKFDLQMPKFSGQHFMAAIPSEIHVEMPPPSFGGQGDPADSIYNLGREMLNRQDYSRGAAKLGEMIAKYPNSRNVTPAAYWQSFALFRVGTMESLRSALKILETNSQQFQYSYNSQYRNDAPALQARVLRALNDRGENGADAKLKDLVAKYPKVGCDDDKIGIQSQVIQSLYQTDPDAAMPYIQDYLKTRDACTARLRTSAIYLLANRGTEANTNLIIQVAKTDTVRSVRTQAIEVLSRMPGDQAIAALQQFMSDPDEDVQRAAVRSLMRSDNPRARAAMRMTLIDNKNAPERQRTEAIRNLGGDNMTPDDAAYLRGLFNRAGESDKIKDAIVSALGNAPSEENLKFLMDVAQNQNEASSVRSNAFRAVTRRQNMTTENLIKMYDATDNRSMRNSIVDALSVRGEPAAIDKLLQIVKLSTDSDVRGNAMRELLSKNDKVITQKVLDLIGKPPGGA